MQVNNLNQPGGDRRPIPRRPSLRTKPFPTHLNLPRTGGAVGTPRTGSGGLNIRA